MAAVLVAHVVGVEFDISVLSAKQSSAVPDGVPPGINEWTWGLRLENGMISYWLA